MELEKIIAYICKAYPNKDDLSKARVNKLIYLSDWKSTLDTGKQISSIHWKFNHYGPYVDDVINEVKSSPILGLNCTYNLFGQKKEIVFLTSDFNEEIPLKKKTIIDKVIEETSKLGWASFIDLVYSTYPVASQPKGSYLDLAKLASEYKAAA